MRQDMDRLFAGQGMDCVAQLHFPSRAWRRRPQRVEDRRREDVAAGNGQPGRRPLRGGFFHHSLQAARAAGLRDGAAAVHDPVVAHLPGGHLVRQHRAPAAAREVRGQPRHPLLRGVQQHVGQHDAEGGVAHGLPRAQDGVAQTQGALLHDHGDLRLAAGDRAHGRQCALVAALGQVVFQRLVAAQVVQRGRRPRCGHQDQFRRARSGCLGGDVVEHGPVADG